jgi:hypothetical protein
MAQNGTDTMEKFKKIRLRRKKFGQTWPMTGGVVGLAWSFDWGGFFINQAFFFEAESFFIRRKCRPFFFSIFF